MDALRQWVLCLIIGAAAGTFVMAVSPRGSMDKTVRAVVGIFVVAAICSPLADFKDADLSIEAMADYEYDSMISEDNDLQEYMLAVFRETVEKQIDSVAEKKGISVNEICMDVQFDADNCIIIHNILLKISEENRGKSSAFSKELEEKLGTSVTVNAE